MKTTNLPQVTDRLYHYDSPLNTFEEKINSGMPPYVSLNVNVFQKNIFFLQKYYIKYVTMLYWNNIYANFRQKQFFVVFCFVLSLT